MEEQGTEELKKEKGHLGGEKLSHPAMGIVSMHRVRCGGGGMSLFGSNTKHREYVEISVYEAEVERELSADWPHQSKNLVSFAMSAAQFADLLLKMNDGDGVPATIVWSYGRTHKMPDLPSKAEQFKKETKEAIERGLGGFKSAYADVEKSIADGQPLTKKGLKELSSKLNRLEAAIDNTLPFIMDQFSEQMNQVVQDAKAEYDAFVQTSIDKLGIEALKNGSPLLESPAGE